MSSCNWLSGSFWIMPLIMLGVMMVGCLVLMLRARHGCCSFKGHDRRKGSEPGILADGDPPARMVNTGLAAASPGPGVGAANSRSAIQYSAHRASRRRERRHQARLFDTSQARGQNHRLLHRAPNLNCEESHPCNA